MNRRNKNRQKAIGNRQWFCQLPIANCILIIAFNFILLTLFSCKKGEQWDCVKSTGKIVQEERGVGTFDILYVEDNINVILTNDSTDKIIVEAGDN
ncbi:MAG: hypothetical protein K2X86_15835, partial [Cytophagaceae bacterium]|nr:hypothetical protein [Cytophagaceae bacterium]